MGRRLSDARALLAELGLAARPALPALRRLAAQDEAVVAYGTGDETARAALQATIAALEAEEIGSVYGISRQNEISRTQNRK